MPQTLSADDEGVFRIDLTHEYVRAVTEQKLGYADLKQIARNGLEYSFVPGASLWQGGDYRPARGGLRRTNAGQRDAGAVLRGHFLAGCGEGGAAMAIRGGHRRL